MERNNLKAALFVTASMVMITTNDAIVKHIAQTFNIGQIMFLRGLLVCGIFAIVLKLKNQPVFYRPALNRWNLIRGLLELFATLTFLTGLALLPIATASTLGFSSPIFLALLASFFIKEKVGVTRWMIIIIGFIGVILISNPLAEATTWAVVFPITCALFVALRDLAIRFVPNDLPSLQVAFTNAWIVMLGGGIYSLFQGWQTAELQWYLWFIGLGAAMVCGYTLQIVGIRMGDLSFVSPFKYTSILLAFGYGYWIWGEQPTPMMLIGAVTIIASGIYLITHEKRRTRNSRSISTPQ